MNRIAELKSNFWRIFENNHHVKSNGIKQGLSMVDWKLKLFAKKRGTLGRIKSEITQDSSAGFAFI